MEALTGSDRPRKYWSDLKKKLLQEGYEELSEKIGQLKLQSSDGKFYASDCANTETMFRIIQSVPSASGCRHYQADVFPTCVGMNRQKPS